MQIVGGIVAAATALYAIFFGQRSVAEWLTNRSAARGHDIANNLPARPRLIGRTEEIAELGSRVDAYPLTVLEGPPGAGKSTVALELAHRCLIQITPRTRHRKPRIELAGVVWLNLRYRPLSVEEVMTSIGLVLDHPAIGTQTGDEKQLSLRRLLTERPTMIFIDNFETLAPDVAVPLLDFLSSLPGHSHAIITTRRYPYPEGSVMRLKNLDRVQTLAFVRQEAQRHGLSTLTAAQDATLAIVFEVTGGSPLAIEWLIGQVARRGQGLDMATQALRTGESDIFLVLFEQSWALLNEIARRMLIGLTVFRTSADLNAIVATSGINDDLAGTTAIGQLVELGLVEVHEAVQQQDIRYSLHPLTHLFARAKGFGQDDDSLRVTMQRAIQHYLEFMRIHGENASAVEPDIPNILYLVSWCKSREEHEDLVALADAVHDIVFSLGLFEDRVSLAHDATEAAQRLGRPDMQAHFTSMSAGTYSMMGRYGDADYDLRDGLQAAIAANSPSELAEIRRCAAFNSYRRGAVADADAELAGVADLAVSASDWRTYVDILCLQGAIEFHCGEFVEAEATQRELARVLDDIGWERGKSYPPRDFAELHMLQREYDKAHELLIKAMRIAKHYRDERQTGRIEMSLAKLLLYLGKLRQARAHEQSARQRFERVGMVNELRELDGIARRLRRAPGFVWAVLGRFTAPRPRYTDATVGGD
ncbi:MAG: hypothetical protein ACRDRH_01460 [Pseudonocardia sp.]